MKQLAIIKGNKYGILIRLDAKAPFPQVLEELAARLKASADFFKDAKMALSIEGRVLSQEEEDQVLAVFAEHSRIEIICVMDTDEKREALYRKLVEQAESVNTEDTQESSEKETAGERLLRDVNQDELTAGQFYKGTLRSGQVVESSSSMIVLGDINPGAKVIATGNIIVLGSLKGYAVAGAGGNETAFVAALEMSPMQIKIGNIIGRSIDKKKKKEKKKPQIAYVLDGNIYIEDISKDIMNDINFA